MSERIKIARKDKKLTQDQLAEKLGLHRSSVSAWEQGVNEPSVANLEQLALRLDITFEYLATGRGNSSIGDYLLRIAEASDQTRRVLYVTEERLNFLKQFERLPERLQHDIAKLVADIDSI